MSAQRTPLAKFQDSHGNVVALGREIGRGGEGAVYEIESSPNLVAKIYHHDATLEKTAKLATMVRLASPNLISVAAWPQASLYRVPGGPAIGLVMAKASRSVELHHLYSPAQRKQEFPEKDWAFLIHVARNMAAAFETVHDSGHVIGDVNQSGVTFSPQGTVTLIDCDSFQIRDPKTRAWYLCDVGVPLFTPPELQGHSFRGVERTPNHDGFGLAVLVFHLVFMGRHPFAGRYAGPGDMPLERAIAEYRFAFGRNANTSGMAPPPHALTLGTASPSIAALFERAFAREGARAGARPTAQEWRNGLDALRRELIACPVEQSHKFYRGLSACPWCAVEMAHGPSFFVALASTMPGSTGTKVAALWAAISAMRAPEQRPPLPRSTTAPPSPTIMRPPLLAVAGLPTPPTPRPVPPPSPTRRARRALQTRIASLIAAYFGLFVLAALSVAWAQGSIVATRVTIIVYWAVFTAVVAIRSRAESLRHSISVLDAYGSAVPITWRTARNPLDVIEYARRAAQVEARERLRGDVRVKEAEQAIASWDADRSAEKAACDARRRAATDQQARELTALRASCATALDRDTRAGMQLERDWSAQADRAARSFSQKVAALQQLYTEHGTLDASRRAAVQALQGSLRDRQLNRFLARHRIAAATITGIGSGRAAVLASYGIDTAADVSVTALWAVPGFGQTLIRNLGAWRQQLEGQFTFDPRQGVDPADVAAIEHQFRQRRQQIEAELDRGARELSAIRDAAMAQRSQLETAIRRNQESIALARANSEAIR